MVGGLHVASGAMQLGDVQAFIQYSRQFTMPLAQLGSMVNVLQSEVASAERVFSLLDEEEESAEPAPSASPVFGRGRLVFSEVSFSPEQALIYSLSLVAEPGQTVAIVGPTGAGKTTLVKLMMRFYEIDAARITLDGVDVTRYRGASCARGWGWCCRIRGFSREQSWTKLRRNGPGLPKLRLWRRRGRRMWTGSCGRCRTDTTPFWKTRGRMCRRGRSSC